MDITTRIRRRLLLVASVSVLALTALAAPAATLAKHGDSSAITHTGSCSGASDWKIKVKPDNGQIEVEFEVDQNKNGRTWDVAS